NSQKTVSKVKKSKIDETINAKSAGQAHSEKDHHAMNMDMKTEKTTNKNGKRILYWRAPMDPTYISDKPGKSPMCMDLIPVSEGEEDLSGGPTVVIDPVTVQNIGVRTARVEKKDLYRAIRTVGHLDYNEQKLYRVNVKFSGWIERLYVDETGQPVRKGQPMLEIYSPELVTTQEEYLLALSNAKKLADSPFEEISKGTHSLLESTRRRLLYWDITEEQIKDLEEKGIISKTMTLYSPVDGIVIFKTAEEGMHVRPGMDLYRIADLSTIWVYASIYEYELPWVKQGQTAEMDLPYIPGKVFTGKVDYIYPYLNQKTRVVKLRLVFPNPALMLKPEMYANIQIKSKLGDEVVAVPDEAVLHGGKRNIVFVARGEGKFEPREVVLGPEAEGGYYQVIAGLQPGEEVVTSAQFLLDSESRLKEAIQKMLVIREKSKETEKVTNQ
ncbi:MAG: efflux RND transporter periplasmic adaptor subunit, partial [bacterium]